MNRFEGTIKTWHDDRGFGFIEPVHGGQEIFVHITSFGARSGRPHVGQRVTFEVELNREGKKRAKGVQAAPRARPTRPSRRAGAAQWGTASYFALPLFLVLYFAATLMWNVPRWVGLLYIAASVACVIAYAIDKSAAQAGRWRMAESTLLGLGLAGGWPGAIVAQQILRHKSSKPSFRSAFWATVALNVIGFVLLASPYGRQFLQ